VCFGPVITMNRPGSPGTGINNWEATLWHEFCHVVTLNITNNKMPRWISEGISVYEEFQRDPTWGQQMNPQYRRKILDGELTPIGDLSAAFMSPPGSTDLEFAYYNSALAVEYIVKHYGHKALRGILTELADGAEINRAITKHTASLANIEKEFEAFARRRAEKLAPDVDWKQPQAGQLDPADPNALETWLDEHPNNFQALTIRAKKLMADRRWQDAKEPLSKLIRLYPRYAGEDNAYRLLAGVHRNLGETEKEIRVLSDLAVLSSDAVDAYERLMELGVEQKDWQQVVTNADRYMAVYPMLATVHWRLGLANEELGMDERAIEAYKRLVFLEPTDPAEVNYRLARLLQDRDPVRAKRHVLEALAEAPRFRQAHRLLSKMTKQAKQKSILQDDTP
jgi:tetratricopeptide (TPR) repeat protein